MIYNKIIKFWGLIKLLSAGAKTYFRKITVNSVGQEL